MLTWLKRRFAPPPAASVPPLAVVVEAPAPPAPRGVDGAAVVGAIAEARSDILGRIADANVLTEQEVISAARGVDAVVRCASRNRDETARMVEKFAGGQAQEGLARSLSRMGSRVEEHVAKLVVDAKAQEGAAQRAQASTASLIKASQQIEGMLQAARMLALNARIEAGRGSAQDRAFTVVADEIRSLSEVIARTNSMMQELADSLSVTLGAVFQSAHDARRSTETFAEAFRGSLAQVRDEAAAFQAHADRAMAASEAGMAEIVRASQSALSSLQFQDVVAQGLMRIDQRLHDLQVEVGGLAGGGADARVAPVAHVELGGDKPITRAGAGDITLF
ncbi:MAG TPA: methyl-accepting chemotaxis protein [Haliangiales bacterium]|nr:methyl-accepting chemotaxis protein [Haliangiales bacterium]